MKLRMVSPALTNNTTANAASFRSGFSTDVMSVLERYDSVNDKGELFGGTGTVFNHNNLLYVALRITSSLRMQATRATLGSLPAVMSLS